MSSPLVPPRFLFRYTCEVQSLSSIPKKRGASLLGLAKKYRLPNLTQMDDAPSFAEVAVAWNNEGLGISFEVSGKKENLNCTPETPTENDSVQFWIDTRNTKTIHRASRFCHHFVALPNGSGSKKDQPSLEQLAINNAREASPIAEPESMEVKSKITSSGYLLECWLSKESLNGFDPKASPLIGFEFLVKDKELGEQSLGMSSEFPIHYDPSLWATLNLEG